MRNLLSLYVRQKTFAVAQAVITMSDAEFVISNRSYGVDSARVLELAELSGCTAYDCEFVFLAEKLDVPLVTADKKVLAAYPDIARTMNAFVA